MGKGGDTLGGLDVDERRLAARVADLTRRGLSKYGEGDLVGALSDWEHALALDPDAPRASEYIDYVRAHFDLLEEQFRAAREAAAAAAARDIPVGAPTVDDDDDDAYEAIVVTEDPAEPAGLGRAAPTGVAVAGEVDEGWELEDFVAEPLPPAPAALGPGLSVIAEDLVAVEGGEVGDGLAELAAGGARAASRDERDRFERARTAPVDAHAAAVEADFSELNDVLGGADAGAIEHGIEMSAEPPPSYERLLAVRGPEADAERRPGRDTDDELTVPGGDEPPPLSDRPALAEDAIAAMRSRSAPVGDPPGTGAAALDDTDVRSLDGAVRDDRAPVERDGSAHVHVTFHDHGTRDETMPAVPARRAAAVDLDELETVLAPPGGDDDTEDARERTIERGQAATAWARQAADSDLTQAETTERRAGEWSGVLSAGHATAEDDEVTRDRASFGLRPPTHDPLLGRELELDGVGAPLELDLERGGPPLELDLEGGGAPLELDAGEAGPPGQVGDDAGGAGRGGTASDFERTRELPAIDDIEATRERPAARTARGESIDPADDVPEYQREGRLPPIGHAERFTAHVDGASGSGPRRAPAAGTSAGDAPLASRSAGDSAHGGSGTDGSKLITGDYTSAAAAVVTVDDITARVSAEVDAGAPAGEAPPERTRRRVAALLDRAVAAHDRGDVVEAVVAAELALEEASDSAVAQKLVHARRSDIIELFAAYVGDHRAVPVVALPSHELPLHQLDSRSVFLVSRIDGMLSFDELLDVAGMPRFEAYRHLCKLLLRGIVEVR
ncbi:MAG: hypothetical protein D6689_04805 [Deltaproteobacteria bacterium]|nr:MAG: hypothetical protein D6689_04805 [Deltaproteobacteria bacterium]